MARILEVSFDFMISDDKKYEDIIEILKRANFFNMKEIKVIGYGFKDDITKMYDSYVNTFTEEELQELDEAVKKIRKRS